MGALLGVITTGISAIVPVLLKPKRGIGSLVADASIEEVHEDELTITEHPVEQGATIADHAYKLPAEVVLTYVWSTGSHQNNTFDVSFLTSIYQQLLQLQVDRTLVQVFTGKRAYDNMLLRSVNVVTDKQAENVLKVRVTCREILMATTSVVNKSSDASSQAFPEKTAPNLNQGPQSLRPALNFNPLGIFP